MIFSAFHFFYVATNSWKHLFLLVFLLVLQVGTHFFFISKRKFSIILYSIDILNCIGVPAGCWENWLNSELNLRLDCFRPTNNLNEKHLLRSRKVAVIELFIEPMFEYNIFCILYLTITKQLHNVEQQTIWIMEIFTINILL